MQIRKGSEGEVIRAAKGRDQLLCQSQYVSVTWFTYSVRTWSSHASVNETFIFFPPSVKCSLVWWLLEKLLAEHNKTVFPKLPSKSTTTTTTKQQHHLHESTLVVKEFFLLLGSKWEVGWSEIEFALNANSSPPHQVQRVSFFIKIENQFMNKNFTPS